MQPKVHLSIPQPCHEDWQKMIPTQQGRFCNACAKQVVDFTNMSDTEVLHYFLDKQGENVCGRVYPDQLNRPVTKTVYPKKKKFWQWNYAAMFLLFFSKTASVKAQGKVAVTVSPQQKMADTVVEVFGNIMPTMNKAINGKVIDEKGEAIAGASIIVKGVNKGTVTNTDGEYSIKVNLQKDILTVRCVGFEPKEITLKNAKTNDVVLTEMKYALTGDLVIVGGISTSDNYSPTYTVNHTSVIEVLDNATRLPVKATLAVTKNANGSDTVVTDAKGIYKLKHIKADDKLTVKIIADGYLETSTEIKGWAFNDKKETKRIFLEKAPELADYKKMDEIIVETYGYSRGCGRRTGAMVSSVIIRRTLVDTVNHFKTKLTGGLKIAPNPVQKGSAFTLSYSVKESGSYILQITNTAGQLLQRKPFIATLKNSTMQVLSKASWSSGVYYVSILDAKNKLISTSSFIIQ